MIKKQARKSIRSTARKGIKNNFASVTLYLIFIAFLLVITSFVAQEFNEIGFILSILYTFTTLSMYTMALNIYRNTRPNSKDYFASYTQGKPFKYFGVLVLTWIIRVLLLIPQAIVTFIFYGSVVRRVNSYEFSFKTLYIDFQAFLNFLVITLAIFIVISIILFVIIYIFTVFLKFVLFITADAKNNVKIRDIFKLSHKMTKGNRLRYIVFSLHFSLLYVIIYLVFIGSCLLFLSKDYIALVIITILILAILMLIMLAYSGVSNAGFYQELVLSMYYKDSKYIINIFGNELVEQLMSKVELLSNDENKLLIENEISVEENVHLIENRNVNQNIASDIQNEVNVGKSDFEIMKRRNIRRRK